MTARATFDLDIKRARGIKAGKVAATMRAQHVSPTAAARLTREARKALEQAAGVRPVSDETWQMALGIVAGSTAHPCPFCGQGDPFGDPGPAKPLGHAGACSR